MVFDCFEPSYHFLYLNFRKSLGSNNFANQLEIVYFYKLDISLIEAIFFPWPM